jgi:succinate dehydrogenase / fumarate reductase cytochrome b subunit
MVVYQLIGYFTMSGNTKIIRTRPLSPHLSIYKPQTSSVLSILHRITGVGLFLGILLLLWWIILGIYSSFDPNLVKWGFFDTYFGKMLLFAWSWALIFHFLNGIRFLFLDAGYGFEIKSIDFSGLSVFFLSAILTVLCWYVALQFN